MKCNSLEMIFFGNKTVSMTSKELKYSSIKHNIEIFVFSYEIFKKDETFYIHLKPYFFLKHPNNYFQKNQRVREFKAHARIA